MDQRWIDARIRAYYRAEGEWIFAAAISRHVAHASVSLGKPVPSPYPPEWTRLLETGEVRRTRTDFPAGTATPRRAWPRKSRRAD
ncbi:MAG: hypothetical protein ACR2F6_11185 [Mycobacteriales bacterium]